LKKYYFTIIAMAKYQTTRNELTPQIHIQYIK